MTPQKWQQIKGMIQDNFPDVQITAEELPEPEVGEKETLCFTGPLGRMKIDFITRPVILDKQTHGSRRIGSHHEVEYVYSETDLTHLIKAYKWDDALVDWIEINLKDNFSL